MKFNDFKIVEKTTGKRDFSADLKHGEKLGLVKKHRSGEIRSVQTPKIGGVQAKQTFRPDSTPGYQQVTYVIISIQYQ